MVRQTSILALTLALVLTGCGDNSTPAPATAPAAAKPAPTPAETAAALKAEAEKLLTEAGTYIKDHKWELADKALSELEGMKAKLPPEYAPRIDQLKQAIAAAKSGGAALPGGIKLPG